MKYDLCIIGGCGHVGLPLAIALANKGITVCALDSNAAAVARVRGGEMPFEEEGAPALLKKVLENGRLQVSDQPAAVGEADIVISVIGTPVDQHLNPEYGLVRSMVDEYAPHLKDGQTFILRSTVFPGISAKVDQWFREEGKQIHVAFCPERILEGKALIELETLPQIVSAFSEEGLAKAKGLFSLLTHDLVEMQPAEAELTKLFTNVWRYIKFATANQFYMIANNYGLDFYKIYEGMTHSYERTKDFPQPGFAAGPCLFKDAMQLGAFNNGDFYLGHTAMLINEGLPNYVVMKLKGKYDLGSMTVGVLGMAFKGESDDIRESLSYKLKKVLQIEAKETLCTDPYVKDDRLLPLEEVVERSDILVVATPHRAYRELAVPEGKVVADIWNVFGRGGLI